jgi:hypothetical protein
MKDFSKCQCPQAGWCDLLQKEMTDHPPNWRWCQGLTEEERKEYHDKVNSRVRTIRRAIRAGLVDVVNFVDDIPTPTSDYAVCVIPANQSAMDLLDITRDSIKSYAKKCGADYIELSGDQHPYWPMANKYRLHKITSTYKKTLYLDCDVLVTENAPDIFQSTPDDAISAYDEYENWKVKRNVEWIKTEQEMILRKFLDDEYTPNYIKNGAFLEPKSMINGGVLVIPKKLSDYFRQPDKQYPKQWCFDQNLLTLILPKDKLFKLDKKYNCTYNSNNFYSSHKEAYFIHVNDLRRDEERRKSLLTSLKNRDSSCVTMTTVHEDFSMSSTIHRCKNALKRQSGENEKLREYVQNQTTSGLSTDKVCILCLGHSDEQFNSIQNKPYLKKVNLNTLECGKYSGNEWAESRGFLSERQLFPDDAEFYGFVTASWNLKYLDHYRIDNFHNWDSITVLLNSKPEDRVVLCADIFCWCNWINDATCWPAKCVLKSILQKDDAIRVGRDFFKLMKLDTRIHKRVPYSNQQIYHKSLYFEWKKYLEDNDCLNKIDWYVKKISSDKIKGWTKEVDEYSNVRLQAYFMEMLNIAWFTNNDFKFIANTTRRDEWYDVSNMNNRAKSW